MIYEVKKKFEPISVAHRNWKHKGHCRFIHGYAREVEVIIRAKTLDKYGHVYDFGYFKEFRLWLKHQWDHSTLIASDDPYLKDLKKLDENEVIKLQIMDVSQGHFPNMEGCCRFLSDTLLPYISLRTDKRAWLHKINIYEHELNRGSLINEKENFELDRS